MTATQTTTKCLRCQRPLKSAKSVALGVGRTCKAKIAAAAKVAAAKPAQVEKARDLIEVGGVVPLRNRKNRVYLTVSSNGLDTYRTAERNCNCRAGRNGRDCCHSLAVRLILAA